MLLVFALLVTPAATAQALTPRPALSLALTVALGLLVVWLGLGIAYFSVYPAGFLIRRGVRRLRARPTRCRSRAGGGARSVKAARQAGRRRPAGVIA